MSTFKTLGWNSSFAVSTLVTGLVSAWFLAATGAMIADPASERYSQAANLSPVATSELTMTPEGRMKLTVVAARPKSPAPVRVHSASVRPGFAS